MKNKTLKFNISERKWRDDILSSIKIMKNQFPKNGERIKPCTCWMCQVGQFKDATDNQ